MRVAIIGYGGRGMLYAEILKEKGVEISAVCDVNKAKLALAQKRLELADGALYAEEETFFRKGKLADLLIVSTQDQLHLRHAVKGLDLGYDLLLEKPIDFTLPEKYSLLCSINWPFLMVTLSTNIGSRPSACHAKLTE